MKVDFRIDWGYHYLYSRKHYHPTYIWDGNISCTNGKISQVYQLEYPYSWYGIPNTAKETRLSEAEWKSTTKRQLSGIRVVAEVENDAVFTLDTVSAKVSFTAEDILTKGKIDFPVGPKYLGCFITVNRTGYEWFRAELKEGSTLLSYDSLNLDVHDWARTKLAWLSPQKSASWEADIEKSDKDYSETIFRMVCMGVPQYGAVEEESKVEATIPMELYCDGECILSFEHFFRFHDDRIQILEDVWRRKQITPGHHKFELKNRHPELCIGISRIIMSQSSHNHGDLSLPSWCLTDEPVYGRVFAAYPDELMVTTDDDTFVVKCEQGWNDFVFCATNAGIKSFSCDEKTGEIEVFDCEKENPPFVVGAGDIQIPHDNSGEEDWIIDYMHRTRLGNYLQWAHRSGYKEVGYIRISNSAPEDAKIRWAKMCEKYGIYLSLGNDFLDGIMVKEAGAMSYDIGSGEYPGVVYSKDPTEPHISEDMKEASEKYINFLKEDILKVPRANDSMVGFVDASGGVRYSFLAGADCVKMEEMVAHTQTMLSQVRPAAEALSNGRWLGHIAIQHAYMPYKITHLGQFFLCLMQPWIMGASGVYDEDSVFATWSEERQVWDDVLPQGKRDMLRTFYKFTKTHPRKGRCVRNIAFIEGRYAAPFNGFICGTEQDPHYSVWGLFGNDMPEWGHKQPEKCRQLLDVLMPGASTHPLRQKFDKRRFYFSGTPYGDFDCVPIEASTDYLNNYKLLLNLGWNTVIEEDYEKLKSFVKDGGVLLTGIPQFSTHTRREFLRDMEDLALMNNGDLSEFLGIKVNGKGVEYSGQWNSIDFENIKKPELSALPSDDVNEDGAALLADVSLSGAEVVAWDAASGKPMLVKFNYGKGTVYTFTIWAYPGHERFQSFAASWIAELSEKSLSDVCVKDETGEIFWTVWEDGAKKFIKLLNTDWTVPGNVKKAKLSVNGQLTDISVKEGTLVVAEIENNQVSTKEYADFVW